MPQRNKAFTLSRPCYTLAVTDGNAAEMTMYGEIVETRPVDWWTGEPIPGPFIMLDEFLTDLAAIQHVDTLTIRLNSLGGDAYSSVTIHNRLREMKARKVAIVDGVAMSGGSLIMCAADEVRVFPSSLVMIHKCWARMYGAYDADDLEKELASRNATDKSQAAIYGRKCGKATDDVLSLMSATTTMTGQEAIDAGFADTLLDGEAQEVQVSADRRYMRVGSHAAMRMTAQMAAALPDTIKVFDAASAATDKAPDPSGYKDKGGTPMPTTLEALRREDPALADSLLAEARTAVQAEQADLVADERQRMQEIDSLAHLFPADIVQAAKYVNPCSAKDMTYRAALHNAKLGQQFMADLKADARDGGANKVAASPADPEGENADPTQEQLMALGQRDARAALGKKEE